MYKPNRVGQAHIWTTAQELASSANATIATSNNNSPVSAQVTRAAAQGPVYGERTNWNHGAHAIPANNQWGIGSQLTITAPLRGNVIGAELSGNIVTNVPNNCTLVAFITKLTAAVGTAIASATFANYPYLFPVDEETQQVTTNPADFVRKQASFKENILFNDTDPSGTYLFGFMVMENAAAGYNLSSFHTSFTARVLDPSATQTYADPFR